jgi:hypothetical protein
VSIPRRGSKKRPFKYEPNNNKLDKFAVDPATIALTIRFLRGWVYGNRTNSNIPLYAGLIDLARIILGIDLCQDGRWRLPRWRSQRLLMAGISSSTWKIEDERRFFLAVHQVMTTGKFVVATQRRLLASGAMAPAFELLYPNQNKKSAAQKKSEEVVEMSKSQFSDAIITHLFG